MCELDSINDHGWTMKEGVKVDV